MLPLFRALTDLVLAPVCLACERLISPADTARLVCRRCRSLLAPPPPPLCHRCGAPRLATGRTPRHACRECEAWSPAIRFARSACIYGYPADRIVQCLKYGGWRALAEPVAERMAAITLPGEVCEEARIVVHVPTTAARRRQRGYDQAERLASAFARRTGRRHRAVLHRTVDAGSQTALQPVARRANVAGGFRVDPRGKPSLAGTHVLLVDDVLTTGATVAECTRTLVEAGVRCVTVITFARALGARDETKNA